MASWSRFRQTVSYCRYGRPFRKNTDLFTNAYLPSLMTCTSPPNVCAYKRKYGRHERSAQGGGGPSPGIGVLGAYQMPFRLLHVLLDAMTQGGRAVRRGGPGPGHLLGRGWNGGGS